MPPLLHRLALGLVPILLCPALGCDRIRGADTPTTPEQSPDLVVTDPVIGIEECPVPFPFAPHPADRAAYQAAPTLAAVDEPPRLRWMPEAGVSGSFFVELQVVFLFNGRARVTSVLHRSDDCIAAVMARRGHIPHDGCGNQAAYVKSWIQALENDPREIHRAAGEAERISRYLVEPARERIEQLGRDKPPAPDAAEMRVPALTPPAPSRQQQPAMSPGR